MSDEIVEISGGSAQLSVGGERRYTRKFRLHFDNPIYDAFAVCSSPLLPAAYSPYPGDAFAVLVSFSAQQDSDPGRANIWTVSPIRSWPKRLRPQSQRMRWPHLNRSGMQHLLYAFHAQAPSRQLLNRLADLAMGIPCGSHSSQ